MLFPSSHTYTLERNAAVDTSWFASSVLLLILRTNASLLLPSNAASHGNQGVWLGLPPTFLQDPPRPRKSGPKGKLCPDAEYLPGSIWTLSRQGLLETYVLSLQGWFIYGIWIPRKVASLMDVTCSFSPSFAQLQRLSPHQRSDWNIFTKTPICYKSPPIVPLLWQITFIASLLASVGTSRQHDGVERKWGIIFEDVDSHPALPLIGHPTRHFVPLDSRVNRRASIINSFTQSVIQQAFIGTCCGPGSVRGWTLILLPHLVNSLEQRK